MSKVIIGCIRDGDLFSTVELIKLRDLPVDVAVLKGKYYHKVKFSNGFNYYFSSNEIHTEFSDYQVSELKNEYQFLNWISFDLDEYLKHCTLDMSRNEIQSYLKYMSDNERELEKVIDYHSNVKEIKCSVCHVPDTDDNHTYCATTEMFYCREHFYDCKKGCMPMKKFLFSGEKFALCLCKGNGNC